MPRKRNPGERMPSSRLNDLVNQLADGEFADWNALVGEGRKDAAYRQLCQWHRGRCPYDPDEEKQAFKHFDLKSLRKKALKELEDGMDELRRALPRELEGLQSANSLGEYELQNVISRVKALKANATQRGYFERLIKIITFEKRVVRLNFEGEQLKRESQRIKKEMHQAKANLVLAAEINFYRVQYLEAVRDEIYATGTVNESKVRDYQSSKFARTDVSKYPARLVCAKLLIDEFFQKRSGKVLEASQLARRIYDLNRSECVLSPREHSMLLTRMSEWYAELLDIDKAREVIGFFEEIGVEDEENRKIYLKKYLLSLFHLAFNNNADLSFGLKAVEVFERHEAFILQSEQDKDRLLILIFLMAFFLGKHEGQKAKHIFEGLYRIKDQKPPLQYRIQYMVSHLMILFELRDQEAMKLFAKNYREILLLNMPLAAPALELLAFLRGNIKTVANPPLEKGKVLAFNDKIETLLFKLGTFEAAPPTKHGLCYGPYMNWLKSQQLKLVDVSDDSDPPKTHPKRQRGGSR